MKHLWVFLSIFLVTSSAIGASHGAEKVVKVDSFDWSYFISQEESSLTTSLTIKLTANIAPRCDSVSGQNLWKVDVFGSESQDGSGERYGYVEQILNEKQTCKTVNKGSVFKLKNLRTPFDVDGVSCGDASFLCVELAKNRDSSVNFELRYGGHVNSVVACKPLQCSHLSLAAAGRIKKVVQMYSFELRYRTSQQESSSTSSLTISLLANIARRCDSVSGQNLWKVSLFGSESQDGSGERYGYVEQILNKKQTSKTVKKGSVFRLMDLRPQFDVDGVSCGNASFLCVELAKNRNSSVNFELRYGRHANSAVDCRPIQCTDPSIPVTERIIQVHYIPRLFFTYAEAYVRVINSRPGQIQELSIELNLRVRGVSDRVVGGRNMWRVNVYGSRNYYGYETQKLGYTSKALISNDTNYSPDIIPGQTIAFPEITMEFNATGMGCGGQYRYICIELERDTNSEPDFEVLSCGNRKKIVICDIRYICLDQLIPFDEYMKRYG